MSSVQQHIVLHIEFVEEMPLVHTILNVNVDEYILRCISLHCIHVLRTGPAEGGCKCHGHFRCPHCHIPEPMR